MKSLRLWALLAVGVPVAALMVATGCTRKINVLPTSAVLNTSTPTSTLAWTSTPIFTGTSTSTASATSTATAQFSSTQTATPSLTSTATPTVTATATNTDTYVGPTYTFTDTFTITATDTFSNTSTYTYTTTPTSTLTNTETLTRTPTMSFTPTATVNTLLIDDLQDGDGQINAQLVALTSAGAGYWFTFSDGCSTVPAVASAATPIAITDGPSGGSDEVMQVTGSGCTTFGAGVAFNFLNNGTGAKLPYSIPTSITGVRFDIRMAPGTSISSVRFGVADATTTADSGNYGTDLVATSSWQTVTVYFSWMTQPSWAATAAFDMAQVYGLQWQVNDKTGASLGLQVDNVSFVTTAAPPTYTPTVADTSLIDNLEDNNYQINTSLSGVSSTTAGYWFTYGDSSCSLAPPVNPTPAATPVQVADGPAGTTSYVAQMTASGCVSYGALGFNFLATSSSGAKQPYNASTYGYTGIQFDIRMTSSAAVSTVRFMVPSSVTEGSGTGGTCSATDKCSDHFGQDLTVTSSWQTITCYFANLTQAGWGTASASATIDPTQIFGAQWQANNTTGAAIGLQVDNVRFVSNVAPTPTATAVSDCYSVDTMEDNDNQVNTICGRTGYWYCFSDSVGSSTSAAPSWGQSTVFDYNGNQQWLTPSDGMTFKMSSPGYASSNYCARITGVVGAPYAVTGGYPYVGFGFDFVKSTGAKLTYDLSAFSGIHFEMTTNTSLTEGTGLNGATFVRLKFPTPKTAADSDDYGVDILTPSTWTSYQVALATSGTGYYLSQYSWGAQVAWDPTKVYSCQWQYTSGSYPYDLSIDDVTFY